ncbi:MAG: tetratricopeptide repeat protein [Dysgonomonas sp.]
MRKVVYVLLLMLLSGGLNSYATGSLFDVHQTVKPNDDIKTLFDNEQYQDIVNRYAATPRNLSADELTYVARSYYQLGDLPNARKYVDMAVQKDVRFAKAYYIRGTFNNTTGNYIGALGDLQQAIQLAPKQAEYYTELGDVYLSQDNYSEALMNYRKAIKLPQPSEKAYYMIGAVYAGRNDIEKALDTFYVAKTKIVKDKELYVTLLYNIGKIEYDKKNYKKAVEAYRELIEFFPDDYYSIEKVIQCYNAQKDYDQADNTKDKLYVAYRDGLLSSSSMSDMFCTDNFLVGEKEVSAYERFEEPSCRSTFVKNIFYIADRAGNIESTIFLEYNMPEQEGAKGQYQLVMEKDTKRHTYNVVFDEGIRYATLQPYVIDVINGKLKPSSL